VTGYGADEWWRVGPQLHRLRLLTAVDTAAFSAYCMACGRWREAEEIIARVAAGDHAMHGLLVKTTDGNARRNPLIKIAADAAADMVRYASEFGLSPLRARGWRPVSMVSPALENLTV
jgi:P27 family predicted phage terminase small subunit